MLDRHKGWAGWRSCLWAAAVALLVPATSAFAQTAAGPTFSKDVAPILQARCQTCHRPGEMGPMSLLTYEDARPWARAIKTKVAARMMPPWHLDPTVGIQKFANDMSLTAKQIDTIVRWVDAGAPQGDPKDLPAAVKWPSNDAWRLQEEGGFGQPDLILKSTPWTQPAEGQDQWWQPIVDTGLTEDRWVKAIEIRPSAQGRRVVHHVVTYLLQPEEKYGAVNVADEGGLFSEFSVGKIGDRFRADTGKLMKASKLRFDIHYHSVGEQMTAYSEVALWFYPKGVTPKYRVFA